MRHEGSEPSSRLGLGRSGGWMVAAAIAVVTLTAVIELWNGRSPLGPDRKFGLWDGDIWSSENSQRVADAYSFSHIVHDILFYALLWVAARRLPLRYRFLLALMLEAGWEVLENSPFIINRYREATIALGYVGDSLLNSCSDIAMMAFGFLFAFRTRVRISAAAVLGMEIACLVWVRDNLTLNIIMLVHPIAALKAWQSAGHPMP